MAYDVTTVDQPSRPIASIRRVARMADLPRVVPEACGVIWNALKAMGAEPSGRQVGIYWDDVIHLEIGVEVDPSFVGEGEVNASEIPGGLVATTSHFGDYRGLPEAHRAIIAWCDARGHVRSGPMWEVYGHWDADPAKLRTDVFYALDRGEMSGDVSGNPGL